MPSFFFNDPATTEISALPLHGALPICSRARCAAGRRGPRRARRRGRGWRSRRRRSEEHTSELQSQFHLVCRLFFLMIRRPPRSPLFPYTALSRSAPERAARPAGEARGGRAVEDEGGDRGAEDRKSTRLNSSHSSTSYAVFFF